MRFAERNIAADEAPIGAFHAVLAAAERLGVARGALLAEAAREADALDADGRALLARLRDARQPATSAASNASDELTQQVRETLAPLLANGRASVEDVARALGVSARTLQRRLERAGTKFGTLCDDARRAAAFAHLRDPRVAIKEMAFRLGFSEPSTFYRAFRRWTGNTPATYRRALAPRAAGALRRA